MWIANIELIVTPNSAYLYIIRVWPKIINLCLPAHQHHLLWLDITTAFAKISTSFKVIFFFTFVFLGISLFFPTYFSRIAYQKKVFQKFDISDFFSENVTIYSSEEINLQTSTGWKIVVLKMCKVKTYVQFCLLLTAKVEENKGKNKIQFSIN